MLKEIKERRSCRKFDTNRYPSDEDIDKIVQAGLLAPSAVNFQDSIIIVIKDKKTRDAIMELNDSFRTVAGRGDPFYGAPVIFLVMNKKTQFAQYDGALVMENMMLEATHLGLGSIWIHRAKEEVASGKLKEILKDAPYNFDEYEGVGHMALGYSLVEEYPPKIIKENRVYKI